jgi:hypothetical protein
MHDELRRFNTVGDRGGIRFIVEQIFYSPNSTLDGIVNLCSLNPGIQINARSALSTFEYMDLIRIENGSIHLTRKGGYLQNKFGDENFYDTFSLMVIRCMIDQDVISIRNFRIEHTRGILKYEIVHFPLHAAILRNLLLTLGTLILEDGIYILNLDLGLEKVLSREVTRVKRKTGEAELIRSLEAKRLQGEEAEKWALEYEKRRLLGSHLSEKVKLISKIDVSAGFDLLSFNDSDSEDFDRYIEVKSFKGIPHFYWTRNEREVASLKGCCYFIYLIDMDMLSNQSYAPIVIQDPNVELSKDKKWLLETEIFKVVRLHN